MIGTIRPIWVIADNTFREAIRNKILYILLLVALGMILFSMALGKLSLDQSVRVIKVVGLSTISLFGVVIAIFIGVNLLYQELDRKTLYTVLVRPIARFQFVLGKYVGMLMTLLVMTVIMSLVLIGLLMFNGSSPDIPLLEAIVLSFVELMLIVAVAVFFSSFSSPFLSGAFTFGVFLLGRLRDSLVNELPQLGLGPLGTVFGDLSRLLPSLHDLALTDEAIYQIELPLSYLVYEGAYGLAYSAIILVLACFIFNRKDIF